MSPKPSRSNQGLRGTLPARRTTSPPRARAKPANAAAGGTKKRARQTSGASRHAGRGMAKAPAPTRRKTEGIVSSTPQTKRTKDPAGGVAYVDGAVTDLARARISIQDRGFLLGDGVFETLRTSGGKVFRLDEHARRMADGLRAIHLHPSLLDDFHAAVDALVAAGRRRIGDDLYLRVMMTTGPMEDIADTGRGVTVVGFCKRFKPYPMAYYSHGVHVIESRQRKDSANPLSTVKSLSFLPYITARREALAQAAHDALLANEKGRIAEATTSNVFARRDGVVFAPGPEEGALAGVTRGAVLEMIRDAGFDLRTRLTREDLLSAKEAWLTNTTGGVIPLTKVGEHAIGSGRKGELTSRLGAGLEALLRA